MKKMTIVTINKSITLDVNELCFGDHEKNFVVITDTEGNIYNFLKNNIIYTKEHKCD